MDKYKPHSKLNSRSPIHTQILAFTLAEVLITLAIIGIIAAISIPSIVTNHKKKALETGFAKGYGTISQAVNLAIAEHGGIESWDWKDSYSDEEQNEFIKKYFLPYLNVIKFCPSGSEEYEKCFPKEHKTLDGTRYTANQNSSAVLADGSSIKFVLFENCFSTGKRCAGVTIDTNGKKKPNVIGYDYFTFNFLPTGEFAPRSKYNNNEAVEVMTKEQIDADCNTKSGGGYSCPAKIISEGFKINY